MQRTLWNGVCRRRNLLLNPHRGWAQFHSTPPSLAKRNGKPVERTTHRPSKNHMRFSVRQKRANSKRALNNFVLKGCSYKRSAQDEFDALYAASRRNQYMNGNYWPDDFYDHAQLDRSRRCRSNRTLSKKDKKNAKKRKMRLFVNDDDEASGETTFEATIGGRFYTWPFRSCTDFSSQDHATGFKWRNNADWSNNGKRWRDREHRKNSSASNVRGKGWESRGYREHGENSSASNNRGKRWESESDFDYEEEQSETEAEAEIGTGLSSHRIILGLPRTGPLKIDDVKTAFRASALKWHPDKHRGPSQLQHLNHQFRQRNHEFVIIPKFCGITYISHLLPLFDFGLRYCSPHQLPSSKVQECGMQYAVG